MKCMYYLAPSLFSTHQISDDLIDLGIADWFVHVISKDEAGLKKEHLHSANWLETHDLLRDGFIGANLGFMAGVAGAGAVMFLQPFGPETPGVVYFFLVVVATLNWYFPTWLEWLPNLSPSEADEERKVATEAVPAMADD